MLLTISAIGKFGVKGTDGKWYGTKRPLKPTDFEKDATYDVETESWEAKGKSGINIAKYTKVGETKVEAPKAEVAGPTVTGVQAALSKDAYWDKKNDSQKLGGLFHDAAAITAGIVTGGGVGTDEALKVFRLVLDGVIEARERLDR